MSDTTPPVTAAGLVLQPNPDAVPEALEQLHAAALRYLALSGNMPERGIAVFVATDDEAETLCDLVAENFYVSGEDPGPGDVPGPLRDGDPSSVVFGEAEPTGPPAAHPDDLARAERGADMIERAFAGELTDGRPSDEHLPTADEIYDDVVGGSAQIQIILSALGTSSAAYVTETSPTGWLAAEKIGKLVQKAQRAVQAISNEVFAAGNPVQFRDA